MLKEIVELIDDLDHRSPADETVTMTFGDIKYTWDLTHSNANKLRRDLQEWLAAASQKHKIPKPKRLTPKREPEFFLELNQPRHRLPPYPRGKNGSANGSS